MVSFEQTVVAMLFLAIIVTCSMGFSLGLHLSVIEKKLNCLLAVSDVDDDEDGDPA